MRVFHPSPEKLQATTTHCVFAFSTLMAHHNGGPTPHPTFDDDDCPLFVTWNVVGSGGGSGQHSWRLRGCIGTLEPRPLHTALRDFALASALRDSRFAPISASEVPSLKVTVSLLSCFRPAPRWDTWEIGRHGLIIEFTDPDTRARRTATFLPEVAHEQGWSHEETVDALVRKAGYSRRVSTALRASLEVVTYESTTCSLTYAEYLLLSTAHADAAGAGTGARSGLLRGLRAGVEGDEDEALEAAAGSRTALQVSA